MAKFLAIEAVYSWFVIRLALVAFIEAPHVFTKEVRKYVSHVKVMQINGSGLSVRLE